MGTPQSTGKRKIEHDENQAGSERIAIIGSVVVLQLSSASDVVHMAQVCKALHAAVNSNDNVWQSLCISRAHAKAQIKPASKSVRASVHDGHPSATFVPPSKLPRHTWKQVYRQMIQYELVMEDEKKQYQERYERWNKHRARVMCGMRASSPPPVTHYISPNSLSNDQVGGFVEHPGKVEEKVLPFSVNLVQTAAMYLNLLITARETGKFKNQSFLAEALRRYVNFMHLKHKYKAYTLIPTLEIEYVWISHLLRPSKYIHDCMALFGEVIDHNLMIHNSYTYLNKASALKDTSDLYFKEFGERYCSENLISKLQQLPHFNTTGTGPLDPDTKDTKSEVDLGDPWSGPRKTTHINCAPAYVGEVGTMGSGKLGKSIGISVSDLLMDDMWLDDFQKNMKESVKDPLNTEIIFDCSTSYRQPAHMRPGVVYHNLWKAYEKFLYMAAKYPPSKGLYVHPSPAIDIMWHSHMIYPKLYAREVKEWTGYLVDHEPWPDAVSKDIESSVCRTDELWKKEFGVAMTQEHVSAIKVGDAPPPRQSRW